MLTKADILRQLDTPLLDKGRYWLTAGGALVLYGLRETTQDIDLGCASSLADELETAGCAAVRKPDGTRKLHLPPDIDLFEDWGRGTVRLVEGVPTVSPEDLLRLKLCLNRPKDQPDIEKLKALLGRK